MFAYEYTPNEEPYLFEVAPFSCGAAHQVRCGTMRVRVCMYVGLDVFECMVAKMEIIIMTRH